MEENNEEFSKFDLTDEDLKKFQESQKLNDVSRFGDPRDCVTLEDVVGKADLLNIPEISRKIDWVPRKLDIARMAEMIMLVQKEKGNEEPLRIVDVAGHSGFLDRLILDELDKKQAGKVMIEVVDPDVIVTSQAREYYKDKEPRLSFATKRADEYVEGGVQADVVICSWMRQEMDLRPDIEKLNPRIIIFVKDRSGCVGKKESFENKNGYEQSAAWGGVTGHDVDGLREYGFEPGYTVFDNVVLIMTKPGDPIRDEIRNELRRLDEPALTEAKYPWEAELPETKLGTVIHDTDDFSMFSSPEEDKVEEEN